MSQAENTWREQVAVVTGGSRGIGRAIALRLARQGAAVCVNCVRDEAAAQAVASEITATGGRAEVLRADIGNATEAASLLAHAEAALGPVTILVNNAGVSMPGTIDEFDAAKFARMRAVNVDGVIHATRAALPGMRQRRYGRIVNIGSIAAHGTTLPRNAFYAATKAEVSILTRRFALELGKDGITVNAVAPGFVVTDMTRRSRGEAFEAIRAKLSGLAMVGRCGEPEDIAHAVAFLAAPEAGFVTAQIVTVDGGRLDYIGHG